MDKQKTRRKSRIWKNKNTGCKQQKAPHSDARGMWIVETYSCDCLTICGLSSLYREKAQKG
jgi:hypothetical protein